MKKIFLLIACLFVLVSCCGAAAEEAGKAGVLVALGDSYTSGEGLEPYFGQDAPMGEKCKTRTGWRTVLKYAGPVC